MKGEDVSNENLQDIFYFKKAKETIASKLTADIDKDSFLVFILNNVKLFYITVAKEKATKVFSMMNGTKASSCSIDGACT